MCEVTRSNYEDLHATMIKAIQEASFVAFDAEYTALSLSSCLSSSLSDTVEIRYSKLKRNVTQSCICQLGISAYIPHSENRNSYAVQTFNCYLFPQSFGPVDARFICQSSAIEFLSEYQFDFNKFFYNGIPYLNEDQEQLIRTMHKQGRLKSTFDSIKVKSGDVSEMRELRNSIRDWSLAAELNETKTFIAPADYAYRYILLTDLSERSKDILCNYVGNDRILVTKVNDQTAVQKCFDEEFERLFNLLLGFSRIIRMISSLRKPIVGHNCLNDLLFIFKTFHKSLPESYEEFKRELHGLFPAIYDTKHLSLLLRREMKNETVLFQETRLEDLHKMLNSQEGQYYVLYSPYIQHASGFDRYTHAVSHDRSGSPGSLAFGMFPITTSYIASVNSEHIHEAGYDAFLTGYVFIRMAHFLAAKDIRSTEMQPFTFKDHLGAIQFLENHVNIARAALRYVNFGGDDPPHRIPMKFIVTLRQNSGKTLSADEIAHEFLPFGSTDVEIQSSSKAVVTLSISRGSKDVISAFKVHKRYIVTSLNNIPSIKKEKSLIIGFGILLVVASGGFVYLLRN